jgi:hypothetical protein
MMDIFERQRYVVTRKLVGGPLLGFLSRYVNERNKNGYLATRDSELPDVPAAYGDVVMEHLLERLRPAVEKATGLDLYPTYSYVRVYRTGDALAPHEDRPACEISLSLNLGQESASPWPLWIRGAGGAEAVDLEPGDGLVYRGMECEHWRERFEGTRLAQVFLHYVNRIGPHADWRFDRRSGLELSIPLPI